MSGVTNFSAAPGEDHIHLRAGLCQLGRQVRGFVGGDGTGDPKRNPFPGEHRDCSVGKNGHIRSLYFQEKISTYITLRFRMEQT